ncbi:MAG: hypothetical protein IJS62_03020 [Bacteroidales bacterium]|nr:hypothetical protein [Bacteroidales bacterium]
MVRRRLPQFLLPVCESKQKVKWGSGIVEQVSLDLQAAFPESKGFSARNLWRMKQWYMFNAQEPQKLPQLVGEIHDRITGQQDGVRS